MKKDHGRSKLAGRKTAVLRLDVIAFDALHMPAARSLHAGAVGMPDLRKRDSTLKARVDEFLKRIGDFFEQSS